MSHPNAIKEFLITSGISTEESITPYYPKVRDRDDVAVLRCQNSGVILLSRTDHMDISHYEEKTSFRSAEKLDRKAGVNSGFEDAERRYNQCKLLVTNKIWMDIGTGAGGILDLLSPLAKETHAVEPQLVARESLAGIGYTMYGSINDAPDEHFEVISLFHVLEHFIDQKETLNSIVQKMKPGATLIVEIPHARDFLLSFLDNDNFKAFTLWSEHMILHTRHSIRILLELVGLEQITIAGIQRYPLANHLYWLSEGKPGGHHKWAELRTSDLDDAYENMLNQIDGTDTLFISAKKPLVF